MRKEYISKYGKIVKQCPGLNEYWSRGNLIAAGSSISTPNPDTSPTTEDWAFCVFLRERSSEE